MSIATSFNTASVLGFGSSLRADFVPPGPADFELPPIFTVAGVAVTKPMLMLFLSTILIVWFFWAASRRAEVVPSRLQYSGELVYGALRNSIARDSIGSEKFMPFVPFLFSLFMVILVNNYFGLIPFIQFPTYSHFGFAVALAIITWFVYIGAGMYVHGPLRYFKHQTVPAGVSGPILPLIVVLEFLSNIIVRPATLCLRLFANMFAGHLLLMLFAFGGQYLIFEASSGINVVAGVFSFLMFGAISLLELLVMFLQAYVFTLLAAMYIGEAVAESH